MKNNRVLYIDASNQILGRLASIIAKKLLEGYRIYVVNVEKCAISGNRKRIVDSYKLLFNVKTHYNPYKTGIRRPRTPHGIFKRTVRGMLPMDKEKGREALKRLRIYISIPSEFKNIVFTKFPEADANRLKSKYIYLGELAVELGWRRGLSK